MTTIRLTAAAQFNVDETGCNSADDLAALVVGRHTAESLLELCLDGAAADRVQGWHEYVDAIVAAAAS